ncbi:uncharacterized protein LOC126606893 [Malus sylvestris]|uniref:uncharacterized protein LOC126606893 n=1 Tax=Malus sylvestris TaxID=3752 RepID=UPI0021AC4AEE|nr:uncharacterized protein LOC126606893 [Malus sylvestris]
MHTISPGRGRPIAIINLILLSLPLVSANPENRKGSPARFLYFPDEITTGVGTPISGDLGSVEGDSGHLRPFHDERKVQLLTVIPLYLFGTTLHHRCTNLQSRRTIPASRHFRIGIFESSRCRKIKHLYVALSRGVSTSTIKVLVKKEELHGHKGVFTRNVVYKDIFLPPNST